MLYNYSYTQIVSKASMAGCPENFRESQITTTATFAKKLMGFYFDRSYECAYKI